MPELIEVADYPAVRGAIAADLDDVSLPDDIIALTQYKGVATAMIQRSTDVIDTFTKAAAITLCAALIVHTVPNLKTETDAGVSTEREPFDAEKVEAKLRGLSASLLAMALNQTIAEVRAATRPTLFAVSSSRRGL
jgi:hypothetical protein